MTVADIATIIGAAAAAIVLIMNTFATLVIKRHQTLFHQETQKNVEMQIEKLDVIHVQTNSELASLREQLRIATAKIERLETKGGGS